MSNKKQEIIDRTIETLRDTADLKGLKVLTEVPEDVVVTKEQCLENVAKELSLYDEGYVAKFLELVLEDIAKNSH